MPSRVAEIVFPSGGLVRHVGYQQGPVFASPLTQNVRPFDPLETRQRGGARRGTVQTYAYSFGDGGGHVQMLGVATTVAANGTSKNILMVLANSSLYYVLDASWTLLGGGFNAAAKQLSGTQLGSKFYITNARTENTVGINGAITSTNRLSESGVDFSALNIDITKDLVWIYGSVNTESNIYPITDVQAGYIEFGGTMTNQASGVTWQLGTLPRMFDTSDPTAGVNQFMSCPIPASNYTTGTVSITSGVVTLTGGTWAGAPQASDSSKLTLEIPPASGIGTEQYRVAVNTKADTSCTLTNTTTDADRTNVAYTLLWASDYYGVPPLNCPLCCTYRGRLVLAGPGPVWYMSRVLNPNDWDYGYDPNDAARAVAGTNSTAGGIPDPITALIPHSDDYLIFGCERSLWILTADPAYGGKLHALSRDIGVLGPTAWCSLPDGSTVFLSRDGLYMMAAGGRSEPIPVSRPTLPAELIDVDYSTKVVSLVYDIQERGVHLRVTPVNGDLGTHYFIDWVNKTFWLDVYPATQQATAMVRYSANPADDSMVIMGGLDGVLRQYHPTVAADDGTAGVSKIGIGPIRIGGPGNEGVLQNFTAILDAASTDVTWGLYVADSAEEVVAAMTAGSTYWETGTLTAGFNHPVYTRCRGGAIGFVLAGVTGWAVESLTLTMRQGGKLQ